MTENNAEQAIEVCPECDIAGCKHIRDKLRVPVADERAAFEANWRGSSDLAKDPLTGAFTHPDTQKRWAGWLSRAALASAPVAGEAQKPVAWMLIGRLKNSEPKFTLADPAGIYESVYEPLYAAPQASEAVRMEAGLWLAIEAINELALQYRLKYDTEGCNSYHEGGADALDEAEAAIRALLPAKTALSAQPGAQKEQSDA